jgi:cysteine-rich repeat protein
VPSYRPAVASRFKEDTMSRRVLALLIAGAAITVPTLAHAACTDTPVTVTFDSGSGMSFSYSEGGMTVYALEVYGPDFQIPAALTLGDNDGDTSPDLANHNTPGAGALTYLFSMGGGHFAVTGFDFVDFGGATHDFIAYNGTEVVDEVEVSTSGHVTLPAAWSGITSFTWVAEDGSDPGGAMDNLALVSQCCGNGAVDAGEQCDDGNTFDGDCCSATCQYEPSGSFCAADTNICTDDICDGAGTCTHPDLPNCEQSRPCGAPRPPGNPAFEHPKAAKTYQTSLVQAFVSCGNPGGNAPDRTTEGGVPACGTETFNEQGGSPANGWKWDPEKGQGEVKTKATCKGADDISVKVRLKGIVDGGSMPANTEGAVKVIVRTTVNDPSGGDMTTITLSGQLSLTLANGNGALVSTVGVFLSESGMPDLPNGSSFELEDVQVLDPNGNLFAHPGIFMP